MKVVTSWRKEGKLRLTFAVWHTTFCHIALAPAGPIAESPLSRTVFYKPLLWWQRPHNAQSFQTIYFDFMFLSHNILLT